MIKIAPKPIRLSDHAHSTGESIFFVGCLYVLRVLFDNFFGPYAKARGELRALKENFADFKERLAETTSLTKSIETKIAHGDWALREYKLLRRVKLEEIVTTIFSIEKWLDAEVSNALFRTTSNPGESPVDHLRMLTGLYFPELYEDVSRYFGLHLATTGMADAARSAVDEAKRATGGSMEPGYEERVNNWRDVIAHQLAQLAPLQENFTHLGHALTAKAYLLMPSLIEG